VRRKGPGLLLNQAPKARYRGKQFFRNKAKPESFSLYAHRTFASLGAWAPPLEMADAVCDTRSQGGEAGAGAECQTPRAPGGQICLWSCNWKRACSRSASIQAASAAGLRRPKAQLKRTALTRAASLCLAITSRAHS
jgi:hypothetical protein